MPESCSDLGAESQVTEEMVDAFMEAGGLHLQHHSRARHRRSLEAALPLSPLTRRVEELEAEKREAYEVVAELSAPAGRVHYYAVRLAERAVSLPDAELIVDCVRRLRALLKGR